MREEGGVAQDHIERKTEGWGLKRLRGWWSPPNTELSPACQTAGHLPSRNVYSSRGCGAGGRVEVLRKEMIWTG